MGCPYCGYSVGHASWCQVLTGSAVNPPATIADMAAHDEYVEQLRRDKAKLIQDLIAERRRREAAEERADDWRVGAEKAWERGTCPICFSGDEDGHAEGCYLGIVEAERDALQADNARLREALDDLQKAEAAYRMAHDAHGDGHLIAGSCWDLMRRAGDKARAALAPQGKGGGE